jgi:hypothetical protein
MNKFFSTAITSGVALAGLAGAILATAGPIEARPMSCTAKFNGCSQRCAAAAEDKATGCRASNVLATGSTTTAPADAAAGGASWQT